MFTTIAYPPLNTLNKWVRSTPQATLEVPPILLVGPLTSILLYKRVRWAKMLGAICVQDFDR
jgi:hypothetical protein